LILIVAFFLIGAAAIGIAHYASQPPVPDARLRAVNLGMRVEEVSELLGRPTTIYSDSKDTTSSLTGTNLTSQWIYERKVLWSTAWVNVTFTNGSVSRISGDRFP